MCEYCVEIVCIYYNVTCISEFEWFWLGKEIAMSLHMYGVLIKKGVEQAE